MTLLVLLTLIAATAHADAPFTTSRTFTAVGEVLDDVALNAAVGTRTFTVSLGGKYAKANVTILYLRALASAVTLYCSKSSNGGPYVRYTGGSVSVASGVATRTLGLLTESLAVTADTNFEVEYDVRGVDGFQCVAGGTGAGSGDLATAMVTAVVGQ
jgi:membrane-associated protease RseP (regulator of RpoE activity)